MKIKKFGLIAISIFALTFSSVSVNAHPGRLDKKGGHNVNAEGWGYPVGSYHYHQGKDRDVAYDEKGNVIAKSSDTTEASDTKATTSTTAKSLTKAEIKKHQERLNKLKYDCGTPDGVIGKKTTDAIKKFQKDKKLTVNGEFDEATLKALYV